MGRCPSRRAAELDAVERHARKGSGPLHTMLVSLRSSSTEWPPVVAAIASAAALAISLWSLYIARQSLRVSREELQQRQPRLVPYIHAGFIRDQARLESRLIAMSTSVSNLSHSANSLSMLELVVKLRAPSGLLTQLLLPHDPKLASEAKPERGIAPFPLPVHVGAHQTVTGWVLFRLPDALVHGASIQGYTLQITDTHNLQYEATLSLLMEIADEPQVAEEANQTSQA